MNIVVVSLFRNMSGRINRYYQQLHALQQHVGAEHQVSAIAVEGDSFDDTERELVHLAELWQIPLELVKHEHGKRVFGSTEEPERLEALTGVMTAGLDAARSSKADVMLYVESDLVWSPHDVGSVIDIAERRDGDFDVVAPMIFAGEAFYDIWGFIGLDGERFGPFAPYHSSMPGGAGGSRDAQLVEISSCGSCFAMRVDALRKVRKISGAEALRSFCSSARKAKLRIAVAPAFKVEQH